MLVILIFALMSGFQVRAGLAEVVAAVPVLLGFGVALAWISAFVGLALRSVRPVVTIGTLWMIPLQFGSSPFVPTETMPGRLQGFVETDPMTPTVDAVLGLSAGEMSIRSTVGNLSGSSESCPY